MKFLLLISILMLSLSVSAQRLEIGVCRSYTVKAFDIQTVDGHFKIYGDSLELCDITTNSETTISGSGDKVKVLQHGKNLGLYDSVWVKETELNSTFGLSVIRPKEHRSRKYQNDLLIVSEGSGELRLINNVEMVNYLAGVIVSEGGSGKHIEYYKVQAILSRTYALDHLNKHYKEGFQLCDRTHCQAYHNMRDYSPKIVEAVTNTKGLVMISPTLKLAKGFFHANCGGQTSESDFVWNKAVEYCRSVEDTFCTGSWQANWTKKIKADEWKSYMVNHFGFPANDSILSSLLFHFQQTNRHAFYQHPQLGIPLRDLRRKFNLKSTWFSCKLEGDFVVLEGHGFGHGVGLCQEGAMRMAELGYSYQQILKYYFTGISIMDYYQWLFLHQSAEVEVGL